MRAVIYTRVSTDGQRAASHEDQARNCQRIADREGWTVVRRFTDHGVSGTRSDRPEYQAMLRAAEAREFDVLLVDELSRFSRDVVESERAARTLEFVGLRIVAADGYDSNSKARKLHRGMKALINSEYVESIRHETHRGLEGAARGGLSVGGRAYGYRSEAVLEGGKVVGHRVLIEEAQAEWVRWIFERYAEGWSPRKIAGELNARGVPSPGARWRRETRRKDAKWLASAIYGDRERGSGMLHNELYVGVRVWNRSRRDVDPRTDRKVFLRRPAGEHVRVEVPHLRIVSEELWRRVRAREDWVRERYGERVKRALARGKSAPGDVSNFARRGMRFGKYPLSGLLKCHGCGASLVVTGPDQRYVCASFTNGGESACPNSMRLRRTELEARFLNGLAAKLLSAEYEKLFEGEARRLMAAESGRAPDAGARARELEDKVSNIVEAIAEGTMRASPALAAKLADLEAALSKARAAALPAGATRMLPAAMDRYRRLVRELPATAARDPVAGREALREVLGGASITMRPTEDGGVEAVVPLPSLSKLLNCLDNMSSGSGGVL